MCVCIDQKINVNKFCPFFQELALEAARESMILLKNADSKKNHQTPTTEKSPRSQSFAVLPFFVFHLNHFPVIFVNFQWWVWIVLLMFYFKVARNEVENASFAHRSAHRDSRIWRPELIEPAAERKWRARGRRPKFKSAYPDPQILPQCNILSNYPL